MIIYTFSMTSEVLSEVSIHGLKHKTQVFTVLELIQHPHDMFVVMFVGFIEFQEDLPLSLSRSQIDLLTT